MPCARCWPPSPRAPRPPTSETISRTRMPSPRSTPSGGGAGARARRSGPRRAPADARERVAAAARTAARFSRPLEPLGALRGRRAGMISIENSRLVVVSNRLPVVLSPDGKGDWRLERGSGGLVTALEPVLRERGGVWVGWPGIERGRIPDLDDVLARVTAGHGYSVRGVQLSTRQRDDFYLGFANQVIWPLFHDLQTQCDFDPRFWYTYLQVNRKFARGVDRESSAGRLPLGARLPADDVGARAARARERTADRLLPPHPVPAAGRLPEAALARPDPARRCSSYDLVGFQIARATGATSSPASQNLHPEAEIDGRRARSRGPSGHADRARRRLPDRHRLPGFGGAAATDRSPSAWPGSGRSSWAARVILGVDRLDYTKGIPHKLAGFRARARALPGAARAGHALPARRAEPRGHPRVPDRMKEEIERLVGAINGEFTRAGWVPIHYHYRPVGPQRAARATTAWPESARHPAQGRHEPGRQGVLRVPASRAAACSSSPSSPARPRSSRTARCSVNPHDVEEVAAAIHRAVIMRPRSGAGAWRRSGSRSAAGHLLVDRDVPESRRGRRPGRRHRGRGLASGGAARVLQRVVEPLARARVTSPLRSLRATRPRAAGRRGG